MNNLKNIYLDASATTPILPDVLEVINYIEKNAWANASSIHSYGLKACEIVERSRNNISEKLNVDSGKVIFTSGASESIRVALLNASQIQSKGLIVTSSIEHPSVYHTVSLIQKNGWESIKWPVDKQGILKLDQIDKYLSSKTKILSIVWGQGEIGSIQPIAYLANECRKRNILFHTDASQVISQGLIDFKSLNVDYLSFSAHKFGGPKGIGVLIISDNILDLNLNKPGKSEFDQLEFRRGTQPSSLIAGMSLAIDNLNNKVSADGLSTKFIRDTTAKLTSKLYLDLSKINSLLLTGHPSKRLPHHLSFVIKPQYNRYYDGRKIVRLMSDKGVMISSGSACNSNKSQSNIALAALGMPEELQKSSIRFTLGSWITENDIEGISQHLLDVLS